MLGRSSNVGPCALIAGLTAFYAISIIAGAAFLRGLPKRPNEDSETDLEWLVLPSLDRSAFQKKLSLWDSPGGKYPPTGWEPQIRGVRLPSPVCLQAGSNAAACLSIDYKQDDEYKTFMRQCKWRTAGDRLDIFWSWQSHIANDNSSWDRGEDLHKEWCGGIGASAGWSAWRVGPFVTHGEEEWSGIAAFLNSSYLPQYRMDSVCSFYPLQLQRLAGLVLPSPHFVHCKFHLLLVPACTGARLLTVHPGQHRRAGSSYLLSASATTSLSPRGRWWAVIRMHSPVCMHPDYGSLCSEILGDHCCSVGG